MLQCPMQHPAATLKSSLPVHAVCLGSLVVPHREAQVTPSEVEAEETAPTVSFAHPPPPGQL